MKNAVFLALIWASLTIAVHSEKVNDLSELKKPTDILVHGNKAYFMDSGSVHIYEIAGKHLKKFARKGEGPGEIKTSPFVTNTITLHNDEIVIDSLDKMIYYSLEGEFLRQKRKAGFLALQVKPVGDHFVVKEVDRKDKKTEYIVLALYNGNMERVREIARQKSNIQLNATYLIPESIHYAVIGNKIAVEKSPQGFRVEIYGEEGKLVRTIRAENRSIRVSRRDKEKALERYKQDPLVKQFGFERLKSRVRYVEGDLFPEIADIFSDGRYIFVKTFKEQGEKRQYFKMDLNGEILEELALPETWEGDMIAHLNGVEPRLSTFHGAFFYFVLENPDSEEYELHRVGM